MKKNVLGFSLCLSLCCALTACGSNQSSSLTNQTDTTTTQQMEAAKSSVPPSSDYTISPADSFEMQSENCIYTQSQLDSIFSFTFDNLVQESDYIVEATVENVIFTQIDGGPWTQVDVRITNSKAGSLQVGDLISIYELGGCMPLKTFIEKNNMADKFSALSAKQIECSTYVQKPDTQEFPKVGDSALYFLIDAWEFLPEGSFERISGTYESQFTKTADGYDNHGLENPCQFREEALTQAISEKSTASKVKS